MLLLPRTAFLGWMLAACFVASSLWAQPIDGGGESTAKQGSTIVQAYLYVEPYACRVELLIGLPTALKMFEMTPGDSQQLPPDMKDQLISKAGNAALSWCGIKVNGAQQALELTAATVLRGRPGATDVLKLDESVAVTEGMLGLTWQCGAPADIKQVELEWRKFTTTAPDVPVTVIYGPFTRDGMVLNAKSPAGTWKNPGTLPAAKPLAAVPSVPEPPAMAIPLGGILWIVLVGGGAWWAGWLSWKAPRRIALSLAAISIGAWALWPVLTIKVISPWGKPQPITVKEAQPVLQALLRNTYHAFEQRDESAVYDVLARSISGDLLQRIYLQTTQALALEATDGTRVKITDLAVDVDAVTPQADGKSFVAHGQWTAFGRVGHWGHQHLRVNKYKANMTVEPVDGAWKMTGLEVLEEVRDFQNQPASSGA
jgi:hypothetical protein